MALPPLNDTITAIATAPGQAAVGIVRVSGPDSFELVSSMFAPANGKHVDELSANRVVFGHIHDGDATTRGDLVDESLLLTFRAPHSYTGQDVLELQTHGGPAVLRRVLDMCVARGARLAGPGEFTLRAYLSGRIDLVQAEAVLAMVNAQSERARRNASMGLSKALSATLHELQTTLTQVYGNIQAVFDYPEEGVPDAAFREPIGQVIHKIDGLLATANAGRLMQQGAKLAIIGRPNAGKSSLLNALLGYDRSIVSDTPGTTRDYLEAVLELDGIPITAIDTAGIRDTDDSIEASGVRAAKDIAQNADVSLLLIDSSQPLRAEDVRLLKDLMSERSLVVATKVDLAAAWGCDDIHAHSAALDCLSLSIVDETTGLENLRKHVRDKLLGDASSSELWLSSERQAEVLATVKTLLENALVAPDDLAALDLADALQALANLTGRSEIAEDALEHIFANFCVGK
ncbi:MAG: tRNA uridine-5-carboxymethylaminomethyl(34) synthesis GTPase MnmE [Deinococcota bacterium]